MLALEQVFSCRRAAFLVVLFRLPKRWPSPRHAGPDVCQLVSTHRDGNGLHNVLRHILADFVAHVLADLHRKAVVKPGQNTCLRALVGEGAHIVQRWTTPGNVGLSIETSGISALPKTVCTMLARPALEMQCAHGLFRMRRRRADRLPSGIAFGSRIAVEIAVANGGDRPPELIFILGVEHGNKCIGSRDRAEREQARAINDAGLLGHNNPSQDGVINSAIHRQPETRVLCLPCGALCAIAASNILDLIVVGGPLLAIEWYRRCRPEL